MFRIKFSSIICNFYVRATFGWRDIQVFSNQFKFHLLNFYSSPLTCCERRAAGRSRTGNLKPALKKLIASSPFPNYRHATPCLFGFLTRFEEKKRRVKKTQTQKCLSA
jgi:hypothetical protein